MSDLQYYSQFTKQYIALDCVIMGFNGISLNVILIKRNFEPGLGEWALPGGFLEPDESLEESAEKNLMLFTGLSNVYLTQFHVFSEPNRDPGARIVTVGFYALIKLAEANKKLVESNNAFWINLAKLPPLMVDHAEIIAKAKAALKAKAKKQPIGFELLPKKFTLPQLQRLYEAIFEKDLDKRNFRKKILAMDILEKLEEKDKSESKRGAFLYKFNKKKYERMLSKGFHFEM